MAGGGNIDIAIVAFLASGCSRRRRQMAAGEVMDGCGSSRKEKPGQRNTKKGFQKIKTIVTLCRFEFTAVIDVSVCVCRSVGNSRVLT